MWDKRPRHIVIDDSACKIQAECPLNCCEYWVLAFTGAWFLSLQTCVKLGFLTMWYIEDYDTLITSVLVVVVIL